MQQMVILFYAISNARYNHRGNSCMVKFEKTYNVVEHTENPEELWLNESTEDINKYNHI